MQNDPESFLTLAFPLMTNISNLQFVVRFTFLHRLSPRILTPRTRG